MKRTGGIYQGGCTLLQEPFEVQENIVDKIIQAFRERRCEKYGYQKERDISNEYCAPSLSQEKTSIPL